MVPEGEGRLPVRRALLSVDNKRDLGSFARGLTGHGIELWATGGTRTAIEHDGVPCRAAEELTGIGAWFGGRIKTLHPGILGGVLAPRTAVGDRELAEHKLLRIDLVAVNFYPFEQHVAEHPEATDREEFIDVGGITLARAAAKNHEAVVVVTDPSEYAQVLDALAKGGGTIDSRLRLELAIAAFDRCTLYDAAIARGLRPAAESTNPFPEEIRLRRESLQLRYGENPHQKAATYVPISPPGVAMAPAPFDVLKGPSLSFTNLLDLDTALAVVGEFPTPTAAVVKHASPIGVASGTTVREALEKAVATDPVARYGCVVATNRPIGAEDPTALHGVFVDLLAAPEFDPAALDALAKRPKIKVVRCAPPSLAQPRWETHSGLGRILIQESDRRELAPSDFKLVTSTQATPHEACSLDFAWRVARHAKSNAIVLANGSATMGIGSGQPTRVKAVELAIEVAGDRARGAVLASDAFFPFPDGVELAGRAGVRAILQSGGSLRDPEVIATAERYGIAMYFSGWRVFRH
ncbi:MAG: bifunctional phosphoribosylaminoimidazolecarboxamide formyltransferase/IMP cyclohydrolase [Thermoplasmata archaeon]